MNTTKKPQRPSGHKALFDTTMPFNRGRTLTNRKKFQRQPKHRNSEVHNG